MATATAWNQRHEFVEVDPSAPKGSRFIDLTGDRYGKLVVTSLAGKQGALYKWNCQCDCGGSRVCFANVLRQGRYTHCGCESTWPTRKYGVKFSDATYKAWLNMLASCYSVRSQVYEHIGAKGIRVCQRWGESFDAFREDMGKKPRKTTLCRKDSRLDFSPDNCFWAKAGEKTMPQATRYEFNGKSLTLAEWAKELGVSRQRVHQRMQKMPLEVALSYGRCRKLSDSPLGNNSSPLRKGKSGRPRIRPMVARLSRQDRKLRRQQMRELIAQGMTIAKVAAWFGVTDATVFQATKEQ